MTAIQETAWKMYCDAWDNCPLYKTWEEVPRAVQRFYEDLAREEIRDDN